MAESARGRVWLRPNQAYDLRALRSIVDSIDPSGERPLMSTGYAGGFNYHLGRRSASALTSGFSYSNRWKADSLVEVIASHRPPVLLLDHPYYRGAVAARTWEPLKWERGVEWSNYVRADRPYFDRLLLQCRGERPGNAGSVRMKEFLVYDCSTATNGSVRP